MKKYSGKIEKSRRACHAPDIKAHRVEQGHGPDARRRRGGSRSRKGRHFLRLRRAGRGDQPVLLGAEGARLDPPHPGAACRGGLAHGGGLYARHGRQYRALHRHVRPGRHRHDHRALFGRGGFHPDPLHHRPGAACAAEQGGFPGRRHRRDRRTRRQVGGHRHGALSGADGAAEGVPSDALVAAGAGADRPAGRRPACRDRVRHRRLRAARGLQAGDDARPGREGAGDAQRGQEAADRRRRRHHQRGRVRPADRIRRDHRRSGHPDADGLGHDPRRPPADGRHVRAADLAPLRQRDHAGGGLRLRHRQPLGEPPHRLGRDLYEGQEDRPCRHRADADRPRLRAGSRHRLGCGRGAEDAARRRHRVEDGRQARRLVGLGEGMPGAQEDDEAQDAFRPGAAEAAARLRGDEQGVRPRHDLRHHDRA